MEWYIKCLKSYAVFSGRARRKEFWYFTLFNTIIILVLSGLDFVLGVGGILTSLYYLGVIIPMLSVYFRRLHDTGRSGWWLLIALVPFVGAIGLLVFLVTDSERGDNEYGPNPKELWSSADESTSEGEVSSSEEAYGGDAEENSSEEA